MTRALVLVLAGLALHAADAAARQLRGTVLDATSGRALEGATVTLEPADAGVLSTSRSAAAAATLLRALTGPDGTYAFPDLATGPYVLRVERTGYRATRVEVTLRGAAPPDLALALEMDPIALEPVVVSARSEAPGRSDPRARGPGAVRAAAADAGRARFLEPDARVLTEDDLAAPMTFAEIDLLRALQRVPGMSTRDDFFAELWTRGGPWGQTRVYLDDLPLLDPLFAGGALTALGPAAVGGVFLHPGARPASIGEGAAGVVRVGTRSARAQDGLPFLGEMTMGSVQGTAERRFLGGRAGVLAYGRASWFDRLWNTFVDDGHDPDGPFGYTVGSSLWRVDVQPGADAELVLGRFRADDRLAGHAATLVTGSRGWRRNAADQASLAFRWGDRRVRLAAGRSTSRVSLEHDPSSLRPDALPDVVVLSPGAAALRYDLARVEVEPDDVGGRGLSAGAEVTRQAVTASGAASAGATAGERTPPAPDAALTVLSTWAGYRTRIARPLEVEGGVRLDVGAAVGGLAAVRPGPHLAVRFAPADGWFVTAAGRVSHQYLQQIGPVGTRFGAGHVFLQAWTLAGDDAPAARARIVTLGVERALAPGLWLDVDVWRRRTSGAVVTDPTPGLFPDAPVRWRAAYNEAHGLEVGLRKLTGAVSGEVAYAWLRSVDEIGGLRHPAAADRRHGFDAQARWRVRESLVLTGSFEAFSGAPATRTVEAPCLDGLGGIEACAGSRAVTAHGPGGALRGPGYASLDIGVSWSRRFRTWGLGLSGQLRNVTGRRNHGGYLGTDCPASVEAAACVVSPLARDRYQPLRWLQAPVPLLSLRVWF